MRYPAVKLEGAKISMSVFSAISSSACSFQKAFHELGACRFRKSLTSVTVKMATFEILFSFLFNSAALNEKREWQSLLFNKEPLYPAYNISPNLLQSRLRIKQIFCSLRIFNKLGMKRGIVWNWNTKLSLMFNIVTKSTARSSGRCNHDNKWFNLDQHHKYAATTNTWDNLNLQNIDAQRQMTIQRRRTYRLSTS